MEQPVWLQRSEYPFQSRYIDLPAGKMHYVDEGAGPVLVMVHGNPTWSFVYRHLIKRLSSHFRCVAFDHIGFGLSDKPYEWPHRPQDHATNLQLAINHLGLQNITLVVQDWGGPIGLSYAIANPDNVAALVIFNTWLWPVGRDPYYWGFSKLLGGPVGRYLIQHYNLFAGAFMKMLIADKSAFSDSVHQHYTGPLDTPEHRKGSWVFPQSISISDEWLENLWSNREKIAHKPALIAWGMKDIAFREKELNMWQTLFPSAQVIRFPDAGHFVQEEKGAEISVIIDDFLQGELQAAKLVADR